MQVATLVLSLMTFPVTTAANVKKFLSVFWNVLDVHETEDATFIVRIQHNTTLSLSVVKWTMEGSFNVLQIEQVEELVIV